MRPKVYSALSLLSLLAIWQILAILLDNSLLLPHPKAVAQVFAQEISSGQLPYHLGITLLRLLISFIIAMILGTAIGIAMGRHRNLDHFFNQWLIIFLNIPALVTIILCYIWFGLVETAAILAVVVNKLPNVVVTIREGTKALDQELIEMAQVFRFGRWRTLRHVIWPQLSPYLIASARTGLALIWKIVLVVELLGRSDGMGYQLHLFFQMFDITRILAYTFAFILVIQLIEISIIEPLAQQAKKWRR